VTPDEKIELIELLEERTPPDWHTRERRMRAAEQRLGMWENGKFTGEGLAEMIGRARRGDPLSQDEATILRFGFRNGREIAEAKARANRPEEPKTI
jgi:hypothetical protein